jgi:hypothetical protein
MHRIDHPTAAPGNLFTEGDPLSGTPATVVTDDWANAVQEEIVALIEGAGLTLNKASNTQLLTAILSGALTLLNKTLTSPTINGTGTMSGMTSTDGFRATGAPISGGSNNPNISIFNGVPGTKETYFLGGEYQTLADTAAFIARSKDHSTQSGQASIFTSNAGAAVVALQAAANGIVNLPVGLQIGGVGQPNLGSLTASPAQLNALVNGMLASVENASSDTQTAAVTTTGSTDVLTLTTAGNVVAGDVGIITVDFQAQTLGAATGQFQIGPRLQSSGVNFVGLGSGVEWGQSSNYEVAIYGNMGQNFSITLPFRITTTGTARTFTLRRYVAMMPGGGSVVSRFHSMSLRWLYKQ